MNVSWRRAHFNPLLGSVLPGDVKEDPLNWKEGEYIFKSEGFIAADHWHRLVYATPSRRNYNEPIWKFMAEMAPVYLVFRYNLCPDLISRADPDIIKDVTYIVQSDESMSENEEKNIVAQIHHEEWKHHLKKSG